MDGVIFRDVNFWLRVHEVFGTLEKGKVLTKQYLHSDYAKLVEEVVVKLWKDKDATPYFELVNSLEYLPGVKEVFEFIKKQDLLTAIVSASSIDVARRVQKDFGVDHLFANELVIRENRVTGEFLWPIAQGNEKKAEIIRHLCQDLGIKPEEVVYVGDSDKDIEAFKEVGLSVAFNSDCEELKAVATHIVDSDNLADVLPYIAK